jgi:acyl-CoA synthetase (AMP-forming)/AMP-acid ligase II
MNVVGLLNEQAMQRGEEIAIYHGNEQVSFKQLKEESCRGSNYFRSLGLKTGDAVLIFVPMSIDLYIILMALWRHGLTAMFLDPSSGRKNMEDCCLRIQPKAFIGVPKAQIIRIFTPILRRIPRAISTGPSLFCSRWSARKHFEVSAPLLQCEADTPALITFTSGSTGKPKSTVRTHGFLINQKKVLQQTLALKAGNADLATLPIFALVNLALGVTTIIPAVDLTKPGKIFSRPVLDQIHKYQPHTAVASPAFFERLLADKESDKLQCLHSLFTGGAPVFPRFLKKLADRLPNTRIIAVYGSTEAEPICELAFDRVAEHDVMRMADGCGLLAGTVVDQIDCRIIEDTWGTPLPPMSDEAFRTCRKPDFHPGEIVVHGEHVLKGYLGGEGDQDNKFKVGEKIWHRTGDLGYFDDSGRLWLLGRCSAKIQDANGTVFPFAVETAAMQFAEIERAALCALGESRVLVIQTSAQLQRIKEQLDKIIVRFHIDHIVKQKIPVDKRHNAKVDYPTLLKNIKKCNGI